jgi:hypothetical protein
MFYSIHALFLSQAFIIDLFVVLSHKKKIKLFI